jgi:hypothetical protein
MCMTDFASREIASFHRFITSSLDRLVTLVGELDEAGLNWRPPAPNANSLFALATHTLGNAEENILQTLCGRPGRRRREDEFAARGDSAAVAERWRALRADLTAAMAALTPTDLDRERAHPRRGALTGREVLLVVARHAAEHLGQAELTRDLLLATRQPPR